MVEKNFLDELKKAVTAENISETQSLLERIDEKFSISDVHVIIEFVLEIMENNSCLDFGSPGPLVHFMEKYYGRGYEDLLLKSLERKPIEHTVWMANRILNDPQFKGRQQLLQTLKSSVKKENLDDSTRAEILSLLRFQLSK